MLWLVMLLSGCVSTGQADGGSVSLPMSAKTEKQAEESGTEDSSGQGQSAAASSEVNGVNLGELPMTEYSVTYPDGLKVSVELPEGFSLDDKYPVLRADKESAWKDVFSFMFMLSEEEQPQVGSITVNQDQEYWEGIVSRKNGEFSYMNTSNKTIVFKEEAGYQYDTYSKYGDYFAFTEPYDGVSYIGGLGTQFINFDKGISIAFFEDGDLQQDVYRVFERIVSSLEIG